MKTEMKRSLVANFNLVFYGDKGEENPLLDYFDTIVIPAFTSRYVKKSDDSQYFFTKIGLEKAKEWFRRPPYSIKRSGASGQENTGRVHIHERGNKGSKETDFEG